MQFDPENKVVKLCADGMMAEGEGKPEIAKSLFQQAWYSAENDFEAFTAAHYLARHQTTLEDSLKWNLDSLNRAMKVENDEIKHAYPSLYLNIGKSYEDLNNLAEARHYYLLATEYTSCLPAGGYGNMIKAGIE